MKISEKLLALKEQLITWIKENKKLAISAMISLGVALLLGLNSNFIQVSYFKLTDQPDKVVTLLSKEGEKATKRLYYQYGVDYLLEQLTEQSKVFIEKNFAAFDITVQKKVLEAYNAQNLIFQNHNALFDELVSQEDASMYKDYIRRVDTDQFERALMLYVGEHPVLTQNIVDNLYKILSLRGQKLELKYFDISIYDLLHFPHNGDMESHSLKLLDYIAPNRIKELLFKELKTEPIELTTLDLWVDILNKKSIISSEEYVGFINSHGRIKQLQDQYKQVQLQEVDLINIKQSIDLQTEALTTQVVKLTKEIEALNAQISTNMAKLGQLKSYKKVDLYILDQYENGEYEAAIPEKSWLFGSYKPSDQKVRLKTNTSTVANVGVSSFNVYAKGTLEDGSLYYVELSNEQIGEITQLEGLIQGDNAKVLDKQNEINKLNQEISQIRKTNNYDQNQDLITQLADKKANILLEIEKNKVDIQKLFGIGHIIVDEIPNK